MKWLWFFAVAQGCVLWAQSVPSGDFDAISRQAAAALTTKPKEAVDLYRHALAMRPDWAEGWFDLGAALYQTSRFPESKVAFEKAAALAPQNGAVWGFLGLCENQLNNGQRALSDIHRAEGVGLPDDARFISLVRNCAADICIRERNFSDAVQQLRPLAKLGDQSAETVTALGISALGLPYLPTEVPMTKRPLVDAAGRAMWALFSERGEPADQFRKLLAEYGTQPGVHYLAGVYWLEGDPQKARSEFEQELKLSPSHVPARLQIAILDIKDGDAEGALRLGHAALKLEPNNPLAHAVLGRAYEHEGQYAKAAAEFETASRLAPANAQLHFSLSQVYTRMGRHAEAAKQIAEFKRLNESSGQ